VLTHEPLCTQTFEPIPPPIGGADEPALVVDVEGFRGRSTWLSDSGAPAKVDLARSSSILAPGRSVSQFIERRGKLRLELAADYLRGCSAWLAYLKRACSCSLECAGRT